MDRVFLVHGHDGEAKQSVARFLEKLGLQVTILHEAANKSMTIIEKFEANSDVTYAVVLLTPDDVGAVKSQRDQLRFRARQNVILELRYFIAKLGRERVCALIRDDVERPSDYDGILYVDLDPADEWKLPLGRELKGANLTVDLNKIIWGRTMPLHLTGKIAAARSSF